MVVLATITELALIGVVDRGVANRERIVLRPSEDLSLGDFALLLGLVREDGNVLPLFDSFFWFGEVHVSPPSWIYVYTGPGSFKETRVSGSAQPAYVFHWGRETTVFQHEAVVPVLIRLGGIALPPGRGEPKAPLTSDDFDELAELLGILKQGPNRTAALPPFRPVVKPKG